MITKLKKSIYKNFVSLAVPASVKFALDMLMVLADLFMIGKLGANSLAAVGMGIFLISALLGSLENLYVTGGGILIANLKGGNRIQEANQILYNLLFLLVPIAVLTTVLSPFSKDLYLLLQTSEQVAVLGERYFGVILYGSIFLYLDVMFVSYFSSMGNTKIPMNIKIFTVLLNVILNYVLIFGAFNFPKLGVTGAALGTVLATAIGDLIYFYRIWHSSLYGFTRIFSKKMIGKILNLGFPSFVENATFQVTWSIIISMIGTYSTYVLAGFHVGFRVESIAFLPGFGAAVATTALVSQSIGKLEYENAKRTAFIAGILTAFFMGSIGMIMIFFPKLLVAVFTKKHFVVENAALYIRIVGLTQIPLALQFAYTAALRGVGFVKEVAIMKIILLWVSVVIPSIVVVKLGYSVAWLYVLISSANIIDAAVFIYLFKKETWKKRHVSI